VLEPFYLGRFTTPAILPWPNRMADLISGLALLTVGVTGCFRVLVAGRSGKRHMEGELPPSREHGVP